MAASSGDLAFFLWLGPFIFVLIVNVIAYWFKRKHVTDDLIEDGEGGVTDANNGMQLMGNSTVVNAHQTVAVNEDEESKGQESNLKESNDINMSIPAGETLQDRSNELWHYHKTPVQGLKNEVVNFFRKGNLTSAMVTSAYSLDTANKFLHVMNLTTFEDSNSFSVENTLSPNQIVAQCKVDEKQLMADSRVVPIEQFSHIDAKFVQKIVNVRTIEYDDGAHRVVIPEEFLYGILSFIAMVLTTIVPLVGMFMPLQMEHIHDEDPMKEMRQYVVTLFLLVLFAFLFDLAIILNNKKK
jgi:hypothetical protein